MPAITSSANITQNFGAKGSSADATVKIPAAGSRILRAPYKTLTKTMNTPLNIIAILSAVGIQEASSKPRLRAPRRSGSPTLIKREFSVAIPAPRNTPRIPMYGLVARRDGPVCAGGASVAEAGAITRESLSITCAIGAHPCDDAHSRPQSLCGLLSGFQDDFHRHTLYDLCEVTRRIVRRQQRELRAAGGSHAVDLSLEKRA